MRRLLSFCWATTSIRTSIPCGFTSLLPPALIFVKCWCLVEQTSQHARRIRIPHSTLQIVSSSWTPSSCS
ncbi:unnamed protein product [Symbiodinium sp. CCMP2592]|nr:unnamed protein product [Symbiodinium sp. CCMP2592]